VKPKELLGVRSNDPYRRHKGRPLAIILLGMVAGMLIVAAYNAVQGEPKYYAINAAFTSLLLGLLVMNRLGFVYLAGLFTVVLTGVGSFLLSSDELTATFVTMPIPILIASSLLVPWAGFVVAAIMVAAAAILGIGSLSLLILLIVAIISYLFADSLERAYQESRYQALHDPLTGLPNRILFLDRLEQALSAAERDGRVIAVLFIDLDSFKVINDSLGHHLGDELLVEVSRRIRNSLRSRDTAARFGGDEFTILLDNLRDPGAAIRVTDRIVRVLHEPIVLGTHEMSVSASVGIALSNADPARPPDLLRNADIALYQAKKTGGRYEVFHTEMHTQSVKRLNLETHLRRDIEQGNFEVYYQPQIMLSTGEISEMEALMRWRNLEHALVPPSEFIQVAEETGLILPIGEWVLEEACRQARVWRERQDTPSKLALSVNLSMRQLQDPQLVDKVDNALRKAGLDATTLTLEITETMMMEDEQYATSVLRDLKELGVRISLDDFGRGYSSLNHVKDFPVDSLKIDKTFIDGLGKNPVDGAIVRLIVELAHTLSLKVTAEGVENERQARSLVNMGCDLGQGFYYSKPLRREAAEALLASYPSRWVPN
jgi:diguanylate cyclase (GGDEF)-like protein